MKKINTVKLRGTLYVLPAFCVHVVTILVPACMLFYYAFTNWNGLNKPTFNGLDNFKQLFGDVSFWLSAKNNLIWTIWFLVIPLILGLGFALILIRLRKSQMILRLLIFLPYVVSPTISGKVFSLFYSPYSGIANIFKGSGIKFLETFAPLNNKNQALYAAAFVDNWHWWGFALVLFLSALHQTDEDLNEVAKLDGASFFQKLFYVTIPQIKETLYSYFMFIVVATFMTFDYVWIMTRGGPGGATELFSTYIYRTTFDSYKAGYGSSMSLTVCLMAIACYLLLAWSRKHIRKDYE